MKTKRIICLYGGPGTGKSTTAAGLFYKLKSMGFDCEMNREYVKDWVWEGRKIKPGDQTYFFAKQSRKERQYMEAGVDFIITDSPLVLTHYYGKFDPTEKDHNTSLALLAHHHNICKMYGYKVDHFFLTREKEYNPKGRLQSEADAKQMDQEMLEVLSNLGTKYDSVPVSEHVLLDIIDILRSN